MTCVPHDNKGVALEGLDIIHYNGKFKVAKESEIETKRTGPEKYLPYWERVRLTFLELGGCYIGQK